MQLIMLYVLRTIIMIIILGVQDEVQPVRGVL